MDSGPGKAWGWWGFHQCCAVGGSMWEQLSCGPRRPCPAPEATVQKAEGRDSLPP